jgi:peptidyl-tRNA hydrolase
MESDNVIDDVLVLYIVVNTSLGMSTGKMCAQCAHGSQLITLQYFDLKKEANKVQKQINSDLAYRAYEGVHPHLDKIKQEYAEMCRKINLMSDWMNNASYRKVVLKADQKEFDKIKEEYSDAVVIKDAGFTEIPAGSETVICIWPMKKSNRSKTVKRLQAL